MYCTSSFVGGKQKETSSYPYGCLPTCHVVTCPAQSLYPAVYYTAGSVANTARKSFLSLPTALSSLSYRHRSDFEAFSPARKYKNVLQLTPNFAHERGLLTGYLLLNPLRTH